jgi:hypothetical protein
MGQLKDGERVRWKVTSNFQMTFVEGQRAEVVKVARDRNGPVVTFKNLDHPGPKDHTYVVYGDIPAEQYEVIA